MRILYIVALITLTSLGMQEEQQPNAHLIACCDGTQELTPKQWDLLSQHSKLLQHATQFHDEQHITYLPDIATSSLADIVELLNDQGTYPIDNINRIDALLQGASYLDLTPKKIAPLIVHLKHLISPLDIRNEQTKNILHSCYAWQYRTILNDPVPLISCINRLTGHTDDISSFAICDNNILASGSHDKTIRLWDLVSGEYIRTLSGHTKWVLSLASCENNILASGSYDGTIKLWDLYAGRCIRTLQDDTGPIFALALCENNILASGSFENIIKLWNLNSGQCIKTLFDSGQCISNLSGNSWINTFIMSENNILISGSKDKTIKLWNIQTGECLNTLLGHIGRINTLALCKHNILASISQEKNIKLLDLDSEQNPILLSELTGEYDTFVLTKDNILISGSKDNSLALWNLASSQCPTLLSRCPGRIGSLALYKNNILANRDYFTTIKLWDLSTLDLELYTPTQNALMRTLLNSKDNLEILASILQDPDWKKVYNSLHDSIRHELEKSVPLIQSKNLID